MNKILNIYSADYEVLQLIEDINSGKIDTIHPFNKSIYLDLYSLHILIDQTRNKYAVLQHIDLNNFRLLTEYDEKLFFVCDIDLTTKKWRIDYIVYDSTHKKAFLIKKTILKALKPIFSNISFNKQLSETTRLTIYNIIV